MIRIKKIMMFWALNLLILQNLKAQQIFTSIVSQDPLIQNQVAELSDLFIINEMPKVTAKVDIIKEQMVDVKSASNLKVVKLLLTVQLFQLSGNKSIGSKMFTFSGSGKTEETAIYNAITNIKKGRNGIKNYLEKVNNETSQPDCALAQSELYEYINSGENLKALHLSRQFSYYCSEHKYLFENAFEQIQTLNCEKYLLNAKAYSANKEFGLAVREILSIQPGTKCFLEAEKEIESISKSYDIENDKLYLMYKETAGDQQKYMDFFITTLMKIR
jgi:hypothetical protein